MLKMSEVYRVWEDSAAEKSLILTKETNPQYAYVANYLWFFFIEDKNFHIVACFKELPTIEYHASVKIWFKDEHFCHYERAEPFPFNENKGDTYEILEPDWEFIEVTFRVNKLYGKEYIGPSENEATDENGIIVVVGNQKVFLNNDTIIMQSEVFNSLRFNYVDSVIKLSQVDPEIIFEMLRVLNPPYKRISRYYFLEFLLLACRFRMNRLLIRLDEFSKTDDYDKNWITKVSWKRIQQIFQEDPCFSIQVLENFRVKRREEKAVKKVRMRDPEVQSIHQLSTKDNEKSCFDSLCDYFSTHKTQIVFMLFLFLFIENILLLMWFLCV